MVKVLTQKEFVEGCYNWYREADLQPGNPDDGNWEEAHYPIPKCKDGTATVLLLTEHHAVHGVIQSEELGYPCVWGWEEEYLPAEYLPLLRKWLQVASKLGGEVTRTRFGTKLRITYPNGTIVYANSYAHAVELTQIGIPLIKKLIQDPTLTATHTYTRNTIAYTYAPTPIYWNINNPSKPKPVLIHYPDGTVTYAESMKHVTRITNVPNSTLQHRLKKTLHEQLNVTVTRTRNTNHKYPLIEKI